METRRRNLTSAIRILFNIVSGTTDLNDLPTVNRSQRQNVWKTQIQTREICAHKELRGDKLERAKKRALQKIRSDLRNKRRR